MPETPAPIEALSRIEVVGGNPTPEHAAAAIAVVAGMLVEGGTVDAAIAADQWEQSARSPRSVLDRTLTTWNDVPTQ